MTAAIFGDINSPIERPFIKTRTANHGYEKFAGKDSISASVSAASSIPPVAK